MNSMREASRWNELYSIRVSYLLVCLMMICLMLTVKQFGERLMPGWEGSYLPWFGFLVSLEALFSARTTRKLTIFSSEWFGYRVGEWVLIAILLKLVQYLTAVPVSQWAAIEALRTNFISNFLNGEYLLAVVLVFFVWLICSQYAEDLQVLEVDYLALSDSIPKGIADERLRARHSLVNHVFIHGAIMLVLVTLVRLDWEFVFGQRPPVRSGAIYLLVYFMLGLALLSQTQFTVLHGRWNWQRIELDRELAFRWAIYSMVFLAFIALLALVLPTRFTVGFLTLLGYLINLVFFVGATIMQLLIFLLVSLFSVFVPGVESGVETPITPPPSPRLPPAPSQPAPWLELAVSALFWGVLLAVIGFSVYQYFSHHQDLWGRIGKIPGLTWLNRFWSWFRILFGVLNETITSVVKSGIRLVRRPLVEPHLAKRWRYINLRKLSPKERVYFFYLAMIRRGNEAGHPRGNDQTPYEYERTLRASLPDLGQDLAGMTETFVEARYSRHEVSEETADLVQQWWAKLRRVLRR